MELPPSFGPAHLDAVTALLGSALSSDQPTRIAAEQTLEACENVPGFISILLEIVSRCRGSASVSADQLFLAVVCARNCVRRHWTARAGPASSIVVESERPLIRNTVLRLIGECDGAVHSQLSQLAASIARTDWPKSWPDLLPSLLASLQPCVAALLNPAMSADGLSPAVSHSLRWLKALKDIVSELSSMRLPAAKQGFKQASVAILGAIAPLYMQLLDQLLAEQLRGLSAGSPEATIGASAKFSTAVRVCHTCLRVCEPLIEYGSDEVVSSAAFKPFWVKVVEHMQITDRVRDALQTLLHSPVAAETEAVIGYCDVSLQLLSRCVKHAVTAHGVAFQWAVTPYCEYYYSLLTDKFWRRTPPTPAPAEDGSVDDDDEDTSGECEEFVVCTFATVASVLSEESFFNGSQPAAASIAAFWSSERLNGLLIAAVSHGLLLTPRERKDWAEDPEDYAVHQLVLSKDEAIRPAAENLVLAIVDNHTAVGVPGLLSLLSSAQSLTLTSASEEQLYLLDCVYQIMGITVHKLGFTPDFAFATWFQASLVPVLQLAGNTTLALPYRVLLRRVLWLLQCWMASMPRAIRAQLFGALVYCLRYPDMAVSLAAVELLEIMVNDVDFETEDLTSHFQGIMEGLFIALSSAESHDAKSNILQCLSLLMNTGEQGAIRACAGKVLPLLPAIWSATADEVIIRPHIITIVKGIVVAAASDSAGLWPFVLPVISHSVDVRHSESLTLAGDGLQLWLEVLHHAPTYTSELANMYPSLLAMLENDMEHVEVILKLIEAYIVLGNTAFIRAYASTFPAMFIEILTPRQPRRVHMNAALYAVRCLHKVLSLAGDDLHSVAGLLEPLFKQLLSTCMKCDEETEYILNIPSFADRAEYVKAHPATELPAVVTSYLSLLSRVCVQVGGLLIGWLGTWESEATGGSRTTGEFLLKYLVNAWIVRFDEIANQRDAGGPWYRKLCCAALLSMLPALSASDCPPTARAILEDKIFEILNCAVDVMTELKSDTSASSFIPSVTDTGDPSYSARSVIAISNDVAVRLDVSTFTQQCLQGFRRNVGEAAFANVMANMDPVVTANLPPV